MTLTQQQWLQFIASFLSNKLEPSLASSVGLHGYLIKLSPSKLSMFLTLYGKPFLQLIVNTEYDLFLMFGFYIKYIKVYELA